MDVPGAPHAETLFLPVLGITLDLDPLVITHMHLSVLIYEWVEDLNSGTSRDPSEGGGSLVLAGVKPFQEIYLLFSNCLCWTDLQPCFSQNRCNGVSLRQVLITSGPLSLSVAHGGGSGSQSSTTVEELCSKRPVLFCSV